MILYHGRSRCAIDAGLRRRPRRTGRRLRSNQIWVLTFTDTTATSLVGTGVRMIALCPGQVRTSMHAIHDDSAGPWLEPDTVMDVCLTDLNKGRVLSVPGWRYRAVTCPNWSTARYR